MEKTRVMIVDDSPFSQRMIKDALAGSAYEVIACADTGNNAVKMYEKHLPDIITMDLTLPDMDGLDCCREILTRNPHAKIVILSAMKDEAIVSRGTAIGVQNFLQKPVKKASLLEELQKVLTQEQQEIAESKWLELFQTAFVGNIEDMAALKGKIEVVCDVGTKFISHGIAIIVGLTGNKPGRVIIDVSNIVALKFAQRMLDTDKVSDEDLLNCMAEFANIIAGHGVSQINNLYKDKDMEIRLTPPSILIGESLSIINPKLSSCTTTIATEIGDVHLNVGFVRGK